jgi:hypothetical protein
MIFNTMNLDWCTCTKKIWSSSQMANRTRKEISKKSSHLNSKPFEKCFYYSKHCRNITELL